MAIFKNDVCEAGVLRVGSHICDFVRPVDLDAPLLCNRADNFLCYMLGYAEQVIVLGVLGQW